MYALRRLRAGLPDALHNGRILINMGVHLYAYDTEQDAFTCIHNLFDENRA